MPLTYQPFSETPEITHLEKNLSMNVDDRERAASALAGGLLALVGIGRRTGGGALMLLAGAALIYRGVTGQCQLYSAIGMNTRTGRTDAEAGVPDNKGEKVVRSINVNRPRAEVYRYWRQLENLPNFMEHLERVEVLDGRRSRWTARGPAGVSVEWEAEIINERPDEMLAWQSMPGAQVQNAGSVWFEDDGSGGTRLKVALEYNPPAGAVGAMVAKLFGEAPDQQLDTDLRKFKQAIESGQAQATA